MPLMAAISAAPHLASGQDVRYEAGPNGERLQVKTEVVREQVPVTEMREQQQTIYRPQMTTENYQQQQVVSVPVTQYQLVSRIHGRWNPFVTPYWTHHYEPVTTWQQQVATVQVPVNRVAWQPEVRTVQVPVTTYRTAEKTVTTRVALNEPRPLAGARPLAESHALAGTPYVAAQPAVVNGPSATIGAASPTAWASRPLYQDAPAAGGRKLESDPPKQGTGLPAPGSANTYNSTSRY